jgi:KDO2-lipid IV(A) lauroyltransferase
VAKRASHYAEYIAMRAALSALRIAGWKAGLGFGQLLGLAGYGVVRIRRNVAERQIQFAFPGLPFSEVQRIARESYSHFGRSAVEAALLPNRGKRFVLDLVSEVDGWDVVLESLALGRGLLFVSGHIGNWELGGSWLAARGVNMAAVARRMANPLFDHYLGKTRAGLGLRILPEAEAVRAAPRHLRDGGALALLADQGALGLASTFVPFFGRLARTPRGPAVLAIRLAAPLVFGTCIRQPDGRFHFHFERIDVSLSGNREADVDRMVALYTNALERAVRRAPEQYFWMHRRWKRQPPGQPLLDEADL